MKRLGYFLIGLGADLSGIKLGLVGQPIEDAGWRMVRKHGRKA